MVVQLNPVEVPLLGEAGVHQQFVPSRAVGGAVAATDLAVVVGEGQAPPPGGKGRRTLWKRKELNIYPEVCRCLYCAIVSMDVAVASSKQFLLFLWLLPVVQKWLLLLKKLLPHTFLKTRVVGLLLLFSLSKYQEASSFAANSFALNISCEIMKLSTCNFENPTVI